MMKKLLNDEDKNELNTLCISIRELTCKGNYYDCERLISDAMGKYPHAPEPHNLLGLLLEENGDHLTAMKHFRAAWVLDPAYRPARQNLDCFGTFFSRGKCAYDENDCPEEKNNAYIVEYDESGIGHIKRRVL